MIQDLDILESSKTYVESSRESTNYNCERCNSYR